MKLPCTRAASVSPKSSDPIFSPIAGAPRTVVATAVTIIAFMLIDGLGSGIVKRVND